ncbi:MAG: phosphoglucosamine mutase [Chitinispirillales bacterium]|jgi:phosphomannomutase|nr:phosphoglucosamine mutase [Chitinispirillales bacterium]
MKELPIMSVSGIRGKYGETLDELFFSRIAFIQAKLAGGGKILIGRDTRPTGEKLMKAASRGIRAAGGVPVNIGIAPTPTTCVAVGALGANGGIIITASHNPLPYNGYKMVHSEGRLFGGGECEEVYERFRKGEYPDDDELLKHNDEPAETIDASSIHIDKILSKVDAELIRSKNMCIAVDSINGAAGAVFPKLLEKLSVKWKGVHNKLDGDFVHNPEPRPEYLGDLRDLLRSGSEFWGGFVFDPDADRLATMGERGQEISEEMTLVFAFENILSKVKSDVAANLSTSMLIDDVAGRFGVKVFRTKIGEANVVEGMKRNGCAVAGEGNGGVIYPAISTVRDGIAGLALILEEMARSGKKIYELALQWPVYSIVKDKISCVGINPAELIKKLDTHFSNEKKDLTDGLKIIRDYGWVHLRASNTEPIIRCYAEARSAEQARALADMVLEAAKG